MTVVISDDLVLASVQEFDADNPIIGWQNLVTTGNITSLNPNTLGTVEDPNYPTINLANTSTDQRFQQLTAGEDIAIDISLNGTQNVDYVGIAGHNFGTLARSLRVYGATTVDGSGDPVYSAITQEVIPGNDSPLLWRFASAAYLAIRVIAQTTLSTPATDVAYAAVLYVGELLVLERKIQVAFTPITMGRKADVITNVSERGRFLGRTVIGSWRETRAAIGFMSPDWYRENMDPFVENSITEPFFFAWAPVSWPLEVGYVWTMDIPMPEIQDPTGILRIVLDLQGIAS